MSLQLQSSLDISLGLARRAKASRLARNMTQMELADRAGVSLASLKRFETKGLASLDLTARIALIFDSVQALELVFAESAPASLDDLIPRQPRQRARKKR